MISINQTMNVKFVRRWCTILQILHTRFHLKCLIVPHSAYHKSASTKIFCTIIIAETRSHSSILLRLFFFLSRLQRRPQLERSYHANFTLCCLLPCKSTSHVQIMQKLSKFCILLII